MEPCIGYVTHYYSRIGVAVLSLTDSLKINACVRISGHTTDFTQKIWSIELNHHKILFSGPGSEIAVKVERPVRKGDQVYLISEAELEENEF